MATPNDSTTRFDLLGLEEDEVDYGSDMESKASTPARGDMSSQTPNPFSERRAPDVLTVLHVTPSMGSEIIMNPLDEQQERMLQQRESAQRRPQIMATFEIYDDYMFTPFSVEECLRQTVGQPLASWIIAAAASPEEVEASRVLREKFLVPYAMNPS